MANQDAYNHVRGKAEGIQEEFKEDGSLYKRSYYFNGVEVSEKEYIRRKGKAINVAIGFAEKALGELIAQF